MTGTPGKSSKNHLCAQVQSMVATPAVWSSTCEALWKTCSDIAMTMESLKGRPSGSRTTICTFSVRKIS